MEHLFKHLKKLAVSALALMLLCSATVNDGDDDRYPLKDGFELIHSGFIMCFKHNGLYGFAIGMSVPYIYGYYDFSDNYVCDWVNQGCLLWVAWGKEEEKKWGVFDGSSGEMKTEFIYDRFSEFTRVGYDEKTHSVAFQAKVMIGEKLDSISFKVLE